MMKKVGLTLGIYAALALLVPMTAFAQTSHTGGDVTITGGNLGVGTVSPAQAVHLFKSATSSIRLRLENGDGAVDFFANDGKLGFMAGGFQRMVLTNTGKLGINTTAPASMLHLRQGGNGGNSITIENGEGMVQVKSDGGHLQLLAGGATVLIARSTGETSVKVLEITGGADLSEQFEIHGGAVEPGMVVCIDPENPGQLMVSGKAYARTVAGIVSGAGGLKTGMMMGQINSLADGEHPVALTGRVYCKVDTSNGPVQAGDLLTTSNVPGHAMKVTDFAKAQGAIIGKAMTPLESGKGLVLVLVSLQ